MIPFLGTMSCFKKPCIFHSISYTCVIYKCIRNNELSMPEEVFNLIRRCISRPVLYRIKQSIDIADVMECRIVKIYVRKTYMYI